MEEDWNRRTGTARRLAQGRKEGKDRSTGMKGAGSLTPRAPLHSDNCLCQLCTLEDSPSTCPPPRERNTGDNRSREANLASKEGHRHIKARAGPLVSIEVLALILAECVKW